MNNKQPQGFNQMKPMSVKAGIPEDRHEEFVDMINAHTAPMCILINADKDVAPDYLTVGLITEEDRVNSTEVLWQDTSRSDS